MKLFIKKYIMPIIITFSLYSILYVLRDKDISANYINITLCICMCFAILIRLFDDIVDYNKDLIDNKIIFKKRNLIIFTIILMLICTTITIISKSYLFIIMEVLLLINLINNNILNYSKSLYIPLVCFCILYYEILPMSSVSNIE